MHLKDKDKGDYRCKYSTSCPARAVENILICQWRVFASQTRIDNMKISHLLLQHDCLGAAISNPSTCNNQSWLTE